MQQNNTTDQDVESQRALAQQAANGEEAARRQVNQLVESIIRYQSRRFCVRFCRENKFHSICTLHPPVAQPINRGALCEWGNASYGWMLNDLCSSNRLLKYEGRNGAGLSGYLYQIANSQPFYERWKDWRFGRHVHVPAYIKALGPNAGRVFMLLRSHEPVEGIAQQMSGLMQEPLLETRALCQQIIVLLTRKKRLHLLNPPVNISLTESANAESSSHQQDLADYDESGEDQQQKQQLSRAWEKLSPVEQFVLEALSIEEQDARYVLQALCKMDVSLKKGVPAKKTSVQQLYYFRRKTLAKLAESMA
ncbi:hypothetical protein MNBD_GAMMA11-1154 [hydrothermal vent metagenome]|uniref:Uncharacterized protein n=1 Tax=hydrothermal vent metagenome TaxID=652676 RepID=A0A3B0X200_9ZZZZ